MKIIFDEKIDEENIKTFKRYEISRSDENMYKCCICKKRTCIDNSCSNNGHKLVCMKCAFEIGYPVIRKWQGE